MRFLRVMCGLASGIVCGCMPAGPVIVVDGAGWRQTSSPPQAVSDTSCEIVVLGQSDPRPGAHAVLRKALRRAHGEPLETRALTYANLGIAATHSGALDVAAGALDGALAIMEAVIYDPAKSREIASLSGRERTKIFKGEPHERALCNMYRGIVYLAEGEYESARACFLRADMYRPAHGRNNGSDGSWLSLDALGAFADSRCPSQMGISWNSSEDLQLGHFAPQDDTIVVIATGLCPAKRHHHSGKKHGLEYGCIRSAVSTVEISGPLAETVIAGDGAASSGAVITAVMQGPPVGGIGAAPVATRFVYPTEDIYLQAASNGRREVDKLLAAKQKRSQAGEDAGDVAEVLAAATMGIPYVGYAFFLVGSLSRAGAVGTDSTADLRSVNGPGYVYIGTCNTGGGSIAIRTLSASGSVVSAGRVPAMRPVGGRPNVVAVRVYQ